MGWVSEAHAEWFPDGGMVAKGGCPLEVHEEKS